jgi:hypothetical protein
VHDITLPDWMPDLFVRDLKLGSQQFDIRFKRKNGETEFEVFKGSTDCVARRPMTLRADQLRSA